MSDITLSRAVRSNLLSLQNTASMMETTQGRLASGKKVNSALDNPTNFFTASSLNSRAGDMNALLDGMANGIQTLEAADNGLQAITKTLESMQSTLRQARQDKSFQTSSFSLASIDPNDPDLGSLTISGGAVGNPTSVDLTKTGSGAKIATEDAYVEPAAAGQASIVGDAGLADADVQAATAFTIDFGGESVSISVPVDAGATRTVDDYVALVQTQIDQSALRDKITLSNSGGDLTLESVEDADGDITIGGADADTLFGAAPADPADIQAGERTPTTGSDGQHSFTINGKEITLDTTTGADLETAVATINTQLGTESKFEAYEELGGKIGLRATSDDAGTLTIGGDDAALFGTLTAGEVTATTATDLTFARSVDELVSAINTAFEGQVKASNDNGSLRLQNLSTQDLTVGGLDTEGAISGGTADADISGNAIRAGLADQYNELRDQLDKLADDASFNGINLLRGDNLQITFNETGTSGLDILSKDGDSINSDTLGIQTSVSAEDFDTDAALDGFMSEIKDAISSVRSQSSAFGSSLSIVENRQEFSKNMINTLQTGAANLTLADSNEEAANLLALQTRQQLSSTALSMASQQDQSVLRLF